MEPFYQEPYQPNHKPVSRFALASMILGICSLVLLCTIVCPLILGALGILFGILSKRRSKKLEPPALTGIITSAAGFCLSLVFCIFSIISAFQMLKPENRDNLNRIYEETMGITFDDYIEDLYSDDILEQLEQFYQ